MIAGWIVYTLLATLLLLIAGSAGERMARALGVPSRFLWASIILSAVTLSGVSLAHRVPTLAGSAVAAPDRDVVPRAESSGESRSVSFTMPRTSTVSARATSKFVTRLRNRMDLRIEAARWQRFDALLVAACATLAAAGLLVVIGSVVRLRRMTRTLPSGEIDGVAVLLSHDVGPAALGFVRRQVVVPRWLAALPAEERRTIVLHEQEHAAAGDPMLVLLGVLALALQPWNVPLWIAVARLRFALEADCDARVLRRSGCGARQYGALLLQVHEHEFVNRMRGSFPVTAFVDSTSHLERRVRRMTDRQPKLRSLSTAATCVTALLVAAMAFTVRVSNAEAAPRIPNIGAKAPVPASQHVSDASPAVLHQSVRAPDIGAPWRDALPEVVNTEREASNTPLHIVVRPTREQEPDPAAIGRARSQDSFVPETLLVRASNSMWPMKARITTSGPAGVSRVLVTDTLGRALPSADELIVEGPVRLVLPDARFQLRVESLSGDLMVTTSALPARDPRRGRWISTLLGRSFAASRGAAGESVQVRANGAGVFQSRLLR